MRILVLCCIAALLWSCQKESFTTDSASRLSLLADTLHFDTVFSTAGSTVRSFKIFNNNSRGIRIASIRLGGGTASSYLLNVNGAPGFLIRDVEVPAGDSAYVFVSVNVDSSAVRQPFVVQDSIEIIYNGNRDVVQLQAFAQNARFMSRRTITADETWNNALPYVVLGELRVAAGATLTIEKGTRIFVHNTAPIIVAGSLVVQGGPDSADRVRFAGSRLDEPYRNHPGSWPGIRFAQGSSGNSLAFTQIKSAYQGLLLESNAQLAISETIIEGAFDAGILSQGGNITGSNLQVSNCGKGMVLAGGQYQFDHCTIAGYNTRYLLRKEPLVQAGNAFIREGVVHNVPLSATFRNCIIWGQVQAPEVADEVVLLPNAGGAFSVLFDHVLWKVSTVPATATVSNVWDEDPQFRSVENGVFDFRLQPQSPAINKGKPSGINIDLDGKQRPNGIPDLGAYEE